MSDQHRKKMKPKIKIGNIQTLHDARYCAAVGVKLLGFNMLEPDSSLTAKQVREMTEWLSGPETIATIRYASPDEINSLLEQAPFNYVSLPMDYPMHLTEAIKAPLIFHEPPQVDTEAIPDLIGQLNEAFPNARFEFSMEEDAEDLRDFLRRSQLSSRSILRMEDPQNIFYLMEKEGHPPFGFALGEFVESPEGLLDYQVFDDFIEEYNPLESVSG